MKKIMKVKTSHTLFHFLCPPFQLWGFISSWSSFLYLFSMKWDWPNSQVLSPLSAVTSRAFHLLLINMQRHNLGGAVEPERPYRTASTLMTQSTYPQQLLTSVFPELTHSILRTLIPAVLPSSEELYCHPHSFTVACTPPFTLKNFVFPLPFALSIICGLKTEVDN